ncbi:unnamed protein product [Knipowitschia caucasica]
MRMACDILLQSSHLSPISILPADSAQIIEQTIRAAVEHHLLELKTSIDQDLSFKNHRISATEACGRHGDRGQQTQDLRDAEAPAAGSHEEDPEATPEESSRMDLDQNSINTARQDNQPCETMGETMGETDIDCCDLDSCRCDQNANTSEQHNRNHPSPCQPHHPGPSPHLQLFPDDQWEAPLLSHVHLPPIDFSCMHLQRGGQDPVPAFKSWQGESDSGEAQLSPLAGRMVGLPPLLLLSEEGEEGEGEEGGEGGGRSQQLSPSSARSHPHALARRFLDFGAHSAQRFLQQDDSTSPTKTHSRPRRASMGSREAMRGDSVTHQLTKKLQHLKKKIKQFEEQFEKERNYKPSHGDKAANPKVLKWMTDLTKIRRQIKEAKQRAETELGPHTRPRSNTLPKSFGSTLDQGPHSSSSSRSDISSSSRGPVLEEGPTREETLELIQRSVRGKREEDCWPEDIKKMTKEQLSCEKTVLQKNLLHYEGIHGRPVTREERLVMKPLYERYRLVKQMLTRVSITPITVSPSSKRRSQTLQPIIEGETAHFCEEIREEEEEEQRAEEEEREEEEEEEEEEDEESSGGETPSPDVIMLTHPISLTRSEPRGKTEEGSGKLAMDLRLSSSNASSMPELLEQLWKTRAEKKKLRKTIRGFEEDFYQHNGRNVQKEDRLPMLDEYREYKRIKAKVRLLEVLISKQDSSKSI